MSLKRMVIITVVIGLLTPLVFATPEAEKRIDYPTKAITIVVPWSPGGVSDIRARIMAEYAEEILGQPIAIQNIGGASGTVGTEEALRASADGYTVISVDDATWFGIHSGIGDYTMDDFAPIAMMGKWPLVIAARGDAEWDNMVEFVDAAKANPGAYSFAITAGNQSHMVPVEIGRRTGTQFNFVAPQGDTSRNAALLAGTVDAAMTYVSSGKEYLEAGEFKLLAHTFPERHPAIPDVPTLVEQEIDLVYEMRGGFVVKADTDSEIIAILESAFRQISMNSELQQRLDDLTITTEFMDAQETADYLAEIDGQIAEFAAIITN